MRRILARSSLVLLIAGVGAAPAFAADDEGGGDADKVVYKQKTEIDFEGLDVSGELVKPQSALVLDRKKASFNPLIKLREDFNPEMEQSVEAVK
ncbi:MAG: hypothetical protein RLZZ299_1005 [Pseudomonadota bacterium]|jgi:hypothetical protein